MNDKAIEAAQLAGSVAHDLSIWGLFWQADFVVKIVMLMLIFASIWAWSIILEKYGTLKRLNSRANKFEEAFWSGESLESLYARVKDNQKDPFLKTFSAGMQEWLYGVQEGATKEEKLQAGLRQRIERAMAVSITREMDHLERNMTFLANVGSAAPFIGLFGTVWGIMNSFSSIASTQSTSLAVVAPGIAEALFATALGLVAAIPAVIGYNKYSTELNRYADRLEAFTSEFSAILSRHLEQQSSPSKSSSPQAAA